VELNHREIGRSGDLVIGRTYNHPRRAGAGKGHEGTLKGSGDPVIARFRIPTKPENT
jgi:hypothetical protein